KDAAGNLDPSPASRSLTVDVTAPDTTISGGPSGLTNNNTPSFTFSSDDSGVTFDCKLDGPGATTGSYGACTSPKSYGPLLDGAYTFSVRAKDAAGNFDPSPGSRSFTVDVAAPQTTINSGPSGPTNSTDATFSFSSSESGSSFECKLDGGSFTGCSSPQTYGSLSETTHTFAVRATDQAGNTDATEATRTWTVDTTAPDTTIANGPSGPTKNNAPSF